MKSNKLIMFVVFSVILCISMLGSASAAGNNSTGLANSAYPTYQVDNQRTGQSNYTGPQTNTTKWKYTQGTDMAVIGSDGTIYAASMMNNIITALYPNETEKWTYTLANDDGVCGLAVGNNGTLYIAGNNNLYALNSGTGGILWSYTYTNSTSITGNYLTIGSDGTIYFPSSGSTNLFNAINPDGKLKWQNSLPYSGYNFAMSPDGETIYVQTLDTSTYKGGCLYALNSTDGSIKWSFNTGVSGYGPAVGADGTIYIAPIGSYSSQQKILYALNPVDGSQKWTYTLNGSALTPPTIAKDGTIYIATDGGLFYAFTDNGTNATVKWTYEDSQLKTDCNFGFSITIGSDGTIYTGNGVGAGAGPFTGSVYALTDNGTNATVKWSYDLGRQVTSCMIGSDGTLYVISPGEDENEILYAIQDFVANFTSSVSGLSVNFTDNSSNLPTTWVWDFGDGNSSDQKNPTHIYDKSGTYEVTLLVINGNGDSRTVMKSVKVSQAPTLNPVGDKNVAANETLNFTVSGNDPDSDTLTYSATGLPSGATFDPNTGAFSWTPTASQVGSYVVTFSVSDGVSTTSQDVNIVVGKPNTAPTLNPVEDKSVDEGQSLNFNLNGQDADGDSLSYSATGLPAGATLDSNTGAFSWTPGYSQSGTYHVTFMVSDGKLTDSKTVTITVNNVNQAPVLNSVEDKSVDENQSLNFTVSGSDLDGDSLTYSATGLPTGAILNSTTGAFSWVPGYSQAGTYTVTFSVSDGSLTDSKTMKIMVNNVNRTPTLNSIEDKIVNENKSLNFTVSGSDPDGDSLTFSATGLPSGAVFNSKTGVFSWVPGYSQAGVYPVTFTVSDGKLTVSKTMKITVNNVDNVAPTVTKIDPANGKTNVAASKSIVVTFSEAIKKSSKFWIELLNSSGKAVPFKYIISGKVLTIDPTSNLSESKYKLILHSGCVTDTVGNALALKTSSFSVGTSPMVKSSNPANKAKSVNRSKALTVTFNENIKATSSYWIELVSSNGKSVKISKSISGKTLTIKHTKLAMNTTYKLIIHTGSLTDTAGNPIAVKTIAFTTGKT